MLRCNDCKAVFTEEEVIIFEYDPSPSGISLPSGVYVEWHCPECYSEFIEEE